MRRRRPGLAGAVLRVGGMVALGVAVRNHLSDADEKARAAIYDHRTEPLDRAMPVVTDLGSTYAAIGATAALWAAGRRRVARDLAGAATVAWVAGQVLKPLFGRARPYEGGRVALHVRTPMGLSYPSSHPAVAAAVARVLEPEVREPVRGWMKKMPRLVAFSRVYVGAHYPADVIGGLLLGRASADLWRRYASRR